MSEAAQPLCKILFGSHLYGTATAASDRDYKGVFMPSSRDILLQNAVSVDNQGSGKATLPGEDDIEYYSFMKYIQLLRQGQTVALDMIFAPDWALMGPPHALWRRMQDNIDRFLCNNQQSFARYCQSQANKYSLRGPRLVASEGIELVTTRRITFPRPEAPLLLAIKTGQRRLEEVGEIIEDLLHRLEAAQATSSLPDRPDDAWIDDFICAANKAVVLGQAPG